MRFDCDLCSSSDRTEIEPGICVCMECGFVYVPERRTPQEIAADWTTVYRSGAYDPNWPGVKARLWYVAEWLDQNVSLAGKSVLDIGAGSGLFLDFCRSRGAHPVGLEPDPRNAAAVRARNIFCHQGCIEDHGNLGQYDLVTILWTLENCGDCLAMLCWARNHLAPGGRVVVATGSRILVPYKKSYAAYMGAQAGDLHCFRWSQHSRYQACRIVGLAPCFSNDWYDRDETVTAFSRTVPLPFNEEHDDPQAVIDFFREWKRQWP